MGFAPGLNILKKWGAVGHKSQKCAKTLGKSKKERHFGFRVRVAQ
jgi:hypothetical protein